MYKINVPKVLQPYKSKISQKSLEADSRLCCSIHA
jgi:hypothetical protein